MNWWIVGLSVFSVDVVVLKFEFESDLELFWIEVGFWYVEVGVVDFVLDVVFCLVVEDVEDVFL